MFMGLGLHLYPTILVAMIATFFVHDTIHSYKSSPLEQTVDSDLQKSNLQNKRKTYRFTKTLPLDIPLNNLIGLQSVKENISNIVNLVKIESKRGNTPTIGHYIFQGNPGTGKTTVGRILGKKFNDMNFLRTGYFMEVTRDDLVGQYQGHTTQKTTTILESALGGILFIDEAYSLVQDEKDAFGLEAINTIVPFMENHRDDFILIIAGYTEQLDKFLNSNPGLKSRFNYTVDFEDYNSTELYEIFKSFAKDFNWSRETDNKLKKVFANMERYKDDNFGNGRDVRKVFEKIKQNQSNRLMSSVHKLKRRDKRLYTFEPSDVYNVYNIYKI
jgi:AAA+ superfamily predicted ATPase